MSKQTAACIILVLVSGQTAAAEKKQLWKAVPGHPTVFVDMNSVRPLVLDASTKGTHRVADTSVNVLLNGHHAFDWIACGSQPKLRMTDADVPFYDHDQLVGYLPHKAIRAMVCRHA